ncbi:hypothetical protein BCR44DRAFT_45582, partial [Catenaria anguillulae PL171]
MDIFTESGTRLPSNTEIFKTSTPSIINSPQTTTMSLPPPLTSVVAVPVYTAVHEQTGSDHAPVVGVFDLPFDWAALMADMPMGSAEALAHQDIAALMDLDLTRTASGVAPANGSGGAALKAKLKKTRWILSWRGSDKSLGKVSPASDKAVADEEVCVPSTSSPLAAPPINSAKRPSFAAPEEPVDVDYLLSLNPSLPRPQPDGVSSPTPEPSTSTNPGAAAAAAVSPSTDNESGHTVPPPLSSFRDPTAIVSGPTTSPPTSSTNVAAAPALPPLPTLSRVPRPRASSTGLPQQPHKLTSRGRAHGKSSRKASIALLPGGVPHSPSTPKLPTSTARKVDSPASSQALSPSTPSMASTLLSGHTGTSTAPPTRAMSYATGRGGGGGGGGDGESVLSQRTADVLSMSEIEEARREEGAKAGKNKSKRGWLRRKKSKGHQPPPQQTLVSPTPSENELTAGGKREGRRKARKAGDPCSI